MLTLAPQIANLPQAVRPQQETSGLEAAPRERGDELAGAPAAHLACFRTRWFIQNTHGEVEMKFAQFVRAAMAIAVAAFVLSTVSVAEAGPLGLNIGLFNNCCEPACCETECCEPTSCCEQVSCCESECSDCAVQQASCEECETPEPTTCCEAETCCEAKTCCEADPCCKERFWERDRCCKRSFNLNLGGRLFCR